MTAENNYLEINKQAWNNKVKTHLASDFYDLAAFIKGKSSLNSIELDLLGDISGKSILHLQCHFGQDTISLARMGAEATGIDLSDAAIAAANDLAEQTGAAASFICCNVYDLEQHLNRQFDVVFTTYGTIGWLPDLDRWAKLIARYLKPGGKFVFAEFHPAVWMFDDDFKGIAYNYFKAEPISETESGTYADRDAPITQQYVTWNHSLSEVINNLIKCGLEINVFNEFDYSPYNCFSGTEEFEPGKYRIQQFGNKLPLVYALSATKKFNLHEKF